MFEARHARLAVALATAMVLIAMPAAQAAQPQARSPPGRVSAAGSLVVPGKWRHSFVGS